ncbi:hypothetical protein C5D44_03500 [Rathayibacter sp. AY1B5]|nr:hypothetical protein C5D44_03500 [Rathayibacter sp. AY1B5]
MERAAALRRPRDHRRRRAARRRRQPRAHPLRHRVDVRELRHPQREGADRRQDARRHLPAGEHPRHGPELDHASDAPLQAEASRPRLVRRGSVGAPADREPHLLGRPRREHRRRARPAGRAEGPGPPDPHRPRCRGDHVGGRGPPDPHDRSTGLHRTGPDLDLLQGALGVSDGAPVRQRARCLRDRRCHRHGPRRSLLSRSQRVRDSDDDLGSRRRRALRRPVRTGCRSRPDAPDRTPDAHGVVLPADPDRHLDRGDAAADRHGRPAGLVHLAAAGALLLRRDRIRGSARRRHCRQKPCSCGHAAARPSSPRPAAHPERAVRAARRPLAVTPTMPWSWRISDDAAWVRTEDAVVALLIVGAAEPLVLSDTAASIWSVVAAADPRHCTTELVVDALADAYRVASEQIAGDVERFLAELLEHGLLERSSA